MFLKNEKTVKLLKMPIRLQPLDTLSITKRMIFLYVLSALGILILVSGISYWVLAGSMEKDDIQFLIDKAHILKEILKKKPLDISHLDLEINQESALRQVEKYYIRILDENKNAVLETHGMLKEMPFQKLTDSDQESQQSLNWKAGDGKFFLLMSSLDKVGQKQWHFELAMDVTNDTELLSNYRHKLIVIVALGVLLSALVGGGITRSGLRPLKEIANAVQRVKATHLYERIGSKPWPKELRILVNSFDEMLDRLHDSFTRLSQFSADLAHELRTPIQSFRGSAEVALSRPRTAEEYKNTLATMLEESSRLSLMVDNLLFLAQTESEEFRLKKEPIGLLKEVEAVKEFYEALALEQEIDIRCEGEDFFIPAHPDLLRRALSNVLSNALKYTQPGGKVSLSLNQKDGFAQLNICDNGVGIAAEHLTKVFDRFYRADPSRSQSPQGTGLGLAIVKSIMDLHGGMVTLQSGQGKGTTVFLQFPLQ